MKQFTSHIDFSLTKKRFEMMIKHYSPLRSSTRLTVLIPLIMVIALMFCTNQKENEDTRRIIENDGVVYSNVDLYQDWDQAKELGIERRGFSIMFEESTELPFTGTQQIRFIKNDQLLVESIYEGGVLKSNTRFDDDENIKLRIEYDYIEDRYTVTRQFNEDGILIFEITGPESDVNLGTIKEWYPNGQIKFEMSFKPGMLYHGLMTLYDEKGERIEQELYEDGELVEKIK